MLNCCNKTKISLVNFCKCETLHFSPHIIRVIKPSRTPISPNAGPRYFLLVSPPPPPPPPPSRQYCNQIKEEKIADVWRRGEMHTRFWRGNSKGRPLGRPRHRWDAFKFIGLKGLTKIVINPQVPPNTVKFLTSSETISFSRKSSPSSYLLAGTRSRRKNTDCGREKTGRWGSWQEDVGNAK